MKHLAIFKDKAAIEQILAAEKSIKSRFSQRKALPFGLINRGDEIYLKVSGGVVLGKVEVDNVLFFENLRNKWVEIRRLFGEKMKEDEKFWRRVARTYPSYLTLIFLRNPQRFVCPLQFHKHDRRSWLILSQEPK